MSSVALPVASLSSESDLVRQAARGSSDAFAQLYRRHGEAAWGFAQAVAGDRDSASNAVANGFALTRRSHRQPSGGFRLELLAAVYKCAGAAPARQAGSADAFRGLPQRWRAALWLGEVESMDPEPSSEVLGVSVAEASQLFRLGRRGLAVYEAETSQSPPDDLAPALRSFAFPAPGNLAELTETRWAAPGRDRELDLDRLVRPLWASVGGLIALGLIGVGVLAPGQALPRDPGSPSPSAASLPTCYGIQCGARSGPLGESFTPLETLTSKL